MTTEKHVRYSQDVDTLAAAWYFIMRHCDIIKAPTITITPNGDRYTASIHGTADA